jgi:hypothetical protein
MIGIGTARTWFASMTRRRAMRKPVAMRRAMAIHATEGSERPALAVAVAANPHPSVSLPRGEWSRGEAGRSLLVEGLKADQLAHVASRYRRVIAEVDAAQLAYEIRGAHEDRPPVGEDRLRRW